MKNDRQQKKIFFNNLMYLLIKLYLFLIFFQIILKNDFYKYSQQKLNEELEFLKRIFTISYLFSFLQIHYNIDILINLKIK